MAAKKPDKAAFQSRPSHPAVQNQGHPPQSGLPTSIRRSTARRSRKPACGIAPSMPFPTWSPLWTSSTGSCG